MSNFLGSVQRCGRGEGFPLCTILIEITLKILYNLKVNFISFSEDFRMKKFALVLVAAALVMTTACSKKAGKSAAKTFT